MNPFVSSQAKVQVELYWLLFEQLMLPFAGASSSWQIAVKQANIKFRLLLHCAISVLKLNRSVYLNLTDQCT